MKLRFAAIALSATLVACGGGSSSGDGDVVGDETDIDGVPVIGGGEDIDTDDDLINTIDEDTDLDPNDTFADGCEGLSGTDGNSSTAEWNDNCRIQVGGEHQISSYSQGVQRIIFCRGFDTGLAITEINDFADGNFGPMTRDQLRNFQEAEGIGQDGVVGPETWETLQFVLEQLFEEDGSEVFGVARGDSGDSGNCADVPNFEQSIADGSWVMSETIGNPTTVPFSVGPPVEF